MAHFTATFQTEKNLAATFQSNEEMSAVFGVSFEYDTYSGSYRVTPNAETQVLITKGFLMQENVVVDPIPSNYGLITWNGTILTVS